MMLAGTVVFLLGILTGYSLLAWCIFRLPRAEAEHGNRCSQDGFARRGVVALLAGGLFLWCFLRFGLAPELGRALLMTVFLLVIAWIDFDHHLILDKVLIWFSLAGIGLNAVFFAEPGLADMLGATLLGGGLLLLIAVVTRGGMAGGDIKLAAAIGCWLGWKLTLLSLMLGFIAGGFGGIGAVLLGGKGRKDFIPYGPFIAAGSFIGLLYGADLIRWYLTGRL